MRPRSNSAPVRADREPNGGGRYSAKCSPPPRHLPKAQAVLSALELLAEAAAAFRLATELPSIPDLLGALPEGRPKLAAVVYLLLAMAAATVTFCCRAETKPAFARSRQSSIEVLRC